MGESEMRSDYHPAILIMKLIGFLDSLKVAPLTIIPIAFLVGIALIIIIIEAIISFIYEKIRSINSHSEQE